MVSFSHTQWKCHFCYNVWRKVFHFLFLFRDIFWRWAECEASLIFKGHAQCKKADWEARGKYANENIFRMLEWEGSRAGWPPHSGDEKMKCVPRVTLQGSGPALGKLGARSTKHKKREKSACARNRPSHMGLRASSLFGRGKPAFGQSFASVGHQDTVSLWRMLEWCVPRAAGEAQRARALHCSEHQRQLGVLAL